MSLSDFFNPQGIKCVICGIDVAKERHGFCSKCIEKLPFNSGRICLKCGVQITGISDFCEDCGRQQLQFDAARSVCGYQGAAKELVLRLKFHGQKYLAKPMAHLMAAVLPDDWQFDVVTFVPADRETLKIRGYNQSQLIASAFCDIMNLPLAELARKTGALPPQEKMTYQGRFENMRGAFKVTQTPPQSVLVLDDVKTTGATLSALAGALKAKGCKRVFCLTFASRRREPTFSKL